VSLTSASYHSSSIVRLQKYAAQTIILFIVNFSLLIKANAQTPETPVAEQQLENITENNSDNETEDDSYLQQMQQFIKHPVNLNTANEDELKELKILSPLQIQSLISYRNLFGKFIDVYELQAVPGFTIDVIQKIKPFITVTIQQKLTESIKARLQNGEHSLLTRLTQTLEKSKGYKIDSATNFYPGSPQKILLRYKCQFKNLLQYGLLAEKDAGEQFFKGKQKQGFDFYSAHFFLRNSGIIKSLALGDFTVNLGQGLTQWQSLAFKKSADVINIKREADVLRPYHSAGEIFFHRGAGITIQKNKLQATAFVSYKSIDANFVTDTIPSTDDYISSLQTSGYHRTKSETDDKGIQKQLAFGGNIKYKFKGLHIGANAIQYKFKLPLQKDNDPYNLYALSGSSFGNYSVDYSYTFKNLHFFGEAATNNKMDKAFVNGLLISTSSMIDMSFLYRNISPGYQSLYSNAFTENSSTSNEKGLFAGVDIHPNSPWQFSAYMDFYKFPWLKYRVDAPSDGFDYLIQLTYRPGKQFEIYSRFRSETKAVNYNPNGTIFPAVVAQSRKSWRTQIHYKITPWLSVRSRAEVVWLDNSSAVEQGFLGYTEFIYKPLVQPFKVNIRVQFFEAESYNSRLYAYENDVPYSYSIPVFYDKGIRYYINSGYDISKKITLWLRWAQTFFKNKQVTGTGLDEIKGNKKSEIKLQLYYNF
jgi:DNA uptake protein ComE-like DNA-binding protein